jgi:hypothetical protein
MPRKSEPEQLALIDVEDPKLKVVKKELKEYDKMMSDNREQHSADRVAERTKRKRVLDAVVKSDVKPDSEGVYHLRFDGRVWDICQDSQLKIKKHADKTPDSDKGGGKADSSGGKEPEFGDDED